MCGCVKTGGGPGGRKEGRKGGGQRCSQIGGALHRGSQSDHRRIASRGGDRRQPACMPPRRMHPEPETLEDPALLPQFYSPPLPHPLNLPHRKRGTNLFLSPGGKEVQVYIFSRGGRCTQVYIFPRGGRCTQVYIHPRRKSPVSAWRREHNWPKILFP